uniref:Uncharacterized protein n=1 Tax=Setaria italica TaxID=4555 RepID=K3ZKI8_SETIT
MTLGEGAAASRAPAMPSATARRAPWRAPERLGVNGISLTVPAWGISDRWIGRLRLRFDLLSEIRKRCWTKRRPNYRAQLYSLRPVGEFDPQA